MSIKTEIKELLNAGVISENTAEAITTYYKIKKGSSPNRLIIAFGVLGALLTGLGTILIIAHNWDELPRFVKTGFALLPMLIGQAACIFTLTRKNSTVWRESSTIFLFFAIAAGISLVSQIYNIPGNFSMFLLTWMLLSLPMIYIMNSSVTSLFYIIGITTFLTQTSFLWTSGHNPPYNFLLLFAGIIPYYYWQLKNKPSSNIATFHNWLLPVAFSSSLGFWAHKEEELIIVAYMSLFGLYYLLGNLSVFRNLKLRNNGFRAVGLLGSCGLLLGLSFEESWKAIAYSNFQYPSVFTSYEFIIAALLSLAAVGLLTRKLLRQGLKSIKPFEVIFLIFIPLFILGLSFQTMFIFINFIVLALGINKIYEGAQKSHLGIINFGLLLITALIVCRFFDTNLSFVARGVLFVAIGIGFFSTNYFILKTRNNNEK